MSANVETPRVRGILFSPPMSLAIREGRKFQSRRIIPDNWWRCLDPEDDEDLAQGVRLCPYGVAGDRLYIKEQCWIWGVWKRDGKTPTGKLKWRFHEHESQRVMYERPEKTVSRTGGETGWVYRHARFMPKWASRTTLELTEIRAERLHDISELDAKAEGVDTLKSIAADQPLEGNRTQGTHPYSLAFAVLWDTINDERAPWISNPLVWVLAFQRI